MDSTPTHDQFGRVDGDASPTPDQTRAEKAAMESVAPLLLLPGEDTSTEHPEDCKHWIAVYKELYDFTSDIVAQFHEGIRELRGPAQVYLESHDLVVHEKQVERFAERLRFWNDRAAKLRQAIPGPAPSSNATRPA